jgi:hypothetical protein
MNTFSFPNSLSLPNKAMKTQSFLQRFFSLITALCVSITGLAYAASNISISGTGDGGSYSFGDVPVGTFEDATFTVTNSGPDALTLGAVTISGPNAAQFTTAGPVGPVAANGGSTSFTIRFTPGTTGAKSASFSLVNNSPVALNPYNFALSGTGTAPDITIAEVAEGNTSAFGTMQWGGTPIVKTYTITNTGTAPLTLNTPLIGGANGSEFVATTPASPVAPGGNSSFTVTFTASSRGNKTATLDLPNNVTGSKNPYNFVMSATAIAPVIELSSGAALTNGGELNLGTVDAGLTEKRAFTIRNTGDASLSGITVTKSGANQSEFTISTSPSSTVSVGSSTTFEVIFAPSATVSGVRTAQLQIASNDPSANPYRINLTSTVAPKIDTEDLYGYRIQTVPRDLASLINADGSISSDVTSATALVGDDVAQSVNLGFTFFFYDKAYTSCEASTNGLLVFGGGPGAASYTPTVQSPTATGAPTNFIAPFWTDLFRTSDSKILYATRGQAPNRVFIMQYENMKQYNNTGNSVSFVVKLYEGTNTIEFQYRSISSGWASTGMTFANGIRSRNFPSSPTAPDYVETLAGIYGFQQRFGPMNGGNLPAFPSAIAFTRPIKIKVESAYSRDGSDVLTNVGSFQLGLDPTFGTTIRGNRYGDVKEFRAPAEIYLDKNFGELDGAGEIDDANPAWYRLVNDGYSVDGQQIQGANTFFTKALTQDLTVVWRWRLECAVIVDSATGDGGFGNPVPAVGRLWKAPGEQFIAGIDSNIVNNAGGFRFNTVGYTLRDKEGDLLPTVPVTFPANPVAFDQSINTTRRDTAPITIVAPLKLTWDFTGQVRYTFDAFSTAPGGGSVDGQAFIRVYAADRTTVESTTWNVGANNQVWIESGLAIGRKVELGVFYRTKERSLTLSDFVTPVGGDLSSLGTSVATMIDEVTADQLGESRVARVYTVTNAVNPTNINWLMAPSVYRAVIELGRGLDVDEDGNVPSNQLVPSMPTGSLLQVTGNGPGNVVTTRISHPDGAFVNGDPLRWDMLAKNLLPVRPGAYEVSWPDAVNVDKKYSIEILTGYPGDTVRRTNAAEDISGMRTRLDEITLSSCETEATKTLVKCASTVGLIAGMTVHGPNIPTGSTITEIPNGDTFRISNAATATGSGFSLDAWRYDMFVVMPSIDPGAGFPAQPENAHYRHLFDSVPSRQAPTKLDLDPTDTWKFQDLTFADLSTSAAVRKNEPGVPFTAAGAGRSVLLFSTRANPDEIADGTLAKETYAVRVVRSSPVNVIPRTDPRLVLGAYAMQLGSGSYGITQTGGAPATSVITLGEKFVMDFWLNAKNLVAPAAQSLTNCVTVAGGNVITCGSTAGLVVGMNITGTNITAQTKVVSITNGTTFVINNPATADANGLTLSASNKPITLVSTGNAGLTVSIDEAAATITATYRGAKVVQPLSKSGMSWRHYALHVFTNNFFGVDVTVVDFYLDGIRQEQGFVTEWFPGNADSSVSNTVTPASLRFGVDAEARSAILLDNFRVFNLGTDGIGYLTAAELQRLRNVRDMTAPANHLRGVGPLLSFNFENQPAGSFANQGSLPNIGLGPIAGSLDSVWANINYQEVASRLEITLDNAGFNGSGYILNEVSNYNNRLYTRSAEVGQWGPVYPVNNSVLFTDSTKKLEIAYYENPYRIDRIPHPNVAWPYIATEFNNVVFPTVGPDKDKAIYIASRIGSEGISKTGRPQAVYNLDTYSDFSIYYQNDVNAGGYNPNEEHAIAAPSGRAAVKIKNAGEALANNPPLAAFALQNGINNKVAYSSDPWVLIQVMNTVTGEPEMAAYQVFQTRSGAMPFPRPLDSQVGGTTGLAYEPAATPEARFLTLAAETSFDFSYQFEYPVFAGDLLVPPYPLNIIIGNASMVDERGGNIRTNGVNQRTLWRDAAKHAWIVSGGGGKFFNQFFYPMRADFSMPGAAIGAPIAWLPTSSTASVADFLGDNVAASGTLDDNPKPVKVRYTSAWRSDYPKLKRGETLTYQGGEYFNENPVSNGLPALVAMKAAEIVYDSATPSMVMENANDSELNKASARIIRALDRIETPFTSQQMAAAGFQPGDPSSSKVIVVAERWYFKELGGSLQKRFYFDSLQERLVFRGRLNDKESGNPNLTAGPDPINVLEPAVMTLTEYKNTSDDKGLTDLSSNGAWAAAVGDIFKKSQNPSGATERAANLTTPVFLQGVKSATKVPAAIINEQKTFWNESLTGTVTSPNPALVNLDSFGVGSALVCNPSLLTQAPNGSLYITIAENSRTELDGSPVSLHIVEIVPDRYRGAIKVIEGSDPFSEKVALQHNGEFGANTGDLDYEWWIRDARQIDTTLKNEIDSLATALPDPNWQRYASGPGLHSVVFQGRPDVILADKLVLVRYRHKTETKGWRAVPFELGAGITPSLAWQPGSSSVNAPFQWAGAANSPQFQADGSKRYIPQLVMGWVKRILDRINPYEARYNDFFSNESPATYTSQIQIAGGPFAGSVALNPDKNVIENVGLIELYRTVLNRAASLSIRNSSNGNSTDGINQALLLATTRLSVLYELLAREAYSDAQDRTINAGADDTLGGVASYTHAFQNMEADLMQEELSLLRGTDFRKSYPVYNRMFWNYAKGLGEAAYNVNYNINDVNQDGFINEDDARKLYPQGHGDSWGHFLSAIDMHYIMLKEPNFSWKTRSELYSLMQNVLEVDFLDEKTFARLAAGKARAGRDIVRSTYRAAYTQDPDGQWQGYADNADKARAWGVSEWSHRAGQGAYFDWAVANALLPAEPQGENVENLDDLDRLANVEEIGEVSSGLHEIQIAMDEANSGQNPLGFDSDSLVFDIEQQFYDNSSGGDRRSHFEQVFIRATESAGIALATLDIATEAQNKLRALGDDSAALTEEALRQDLDYRNRLIEIFGTPYTGQIGFGKAYPEGYLGPDTMLYAYLDKTKINQYIPNQDSINQGENKTGLVTYTTLTSKFKGYMDNSTVVSMYNNTRGEREELKEAFYFINADAKSYVFGRELEDLSVPYETASRYGFQAPADWGRRVSTGAVQSSLEDMLAAEMELDSAIADYTALITTYERKLAQLQSEVERYSEKDSIKNSITGVRAGFTTATVAAKVIINILATTARASESVGDVLEAAIPTDPVAGLAVSIPTAPAEGAAVAATETVMVISEGAKDAAEAALEILELVRDEIIARLERDIEELDAVRELDGLLVDLENHLGAERSTRNAIGIAIQNMEVQRRAYFTSLAEGFRLLREREAFNKILASKVQKNRYQDMIFRLSRNEAMSKYQAAFNNTARYTWLAARAYDYETCLDAGHPGAPGALLDRIIKERQLGYWPDGEPSDAHGGLAAILAQLRGNFGVLKGQLGINNPQSETEKISMRSELFRISTLDPELDEAVALRDDIAAANFPADQLSLEQRLILARLDDPANQDAVAQAGASNDRWKDALKARIVPDLNTMPEFVRHCRPFASGVQPGIVIRFSSCIEPGKNFFGLQLAAGDHNYSSANFATKIQSFGVWLDNYNDAGLSTSPRAYLVPVGEDTMRTSTATLPSIRKFSIVEHRIPIPFTINQSNLSSPGYIPKMDGIDGAFGDLRRHGDFRMYHDNGDAEPDDSETISSNRLVSRSLWNTEWMLIIPGANLHADPNVGLEQLADTIQDIKLYFLTYSHQGQ